MPARFDGHRALEPDDTVLAYLGSDCGEEETKYRYYADITAESIRRFPGDGVVDSLSPELREKYSE